MMSNAMKVIIELHGCYYGLLITFYIDGRYPEEIPQFQVLRHESRNKEQSIANQAEKNPMTLVGIEPGRRFNNPVLYH